MNSYLVDAIIEKANPAQTPEAPANAEAAAWILFACLNQGHQAMLHDVMKDSGTSLSLYFLSHLQLIYEQGQLAHQLAEEQVPSGSVPLRAEDVNTLKEVTCAYCSKPLMQVVEGQKFHRAENDGDDSCGMLANQSAMRANRLRDETGAVVRPDSGPPLY